MKQKMSFILVVIMLLAMTVGCSKATKEETVEPSTGTEVSSENTTSTEDSSSEETKEVTTVTVWSNNRHDLEYMEAQIAAYNAENTDNIYIEYVVQSDNYDNMLTMAASSGQMPDLFKQVDKPQSVVDAGLVQPLDDFFTDEFVKVTNADRLKFIGLNVFDDKTYFVPTGLRSGVRLIYNKEIFTANGLTPPTTLQELVDDAKVITGNGAGVEFGTIIPGLSAPMVRQFIPIAETSGVLPYDFVNGKYDFSGYKAIVEGFRQLFEDGSVFPGAQGMKVDPTRVQFSEGNVGFYGNASQEVGVLTTQFPAKEEWGAAPMPSLTGEVKGTLSSTPNLGWMMSADTKVAEAAWKVIEFFGSEAFLKGYIEAGLNLPIGDYMKGVVDLSLTGKLNEFAPLSYEGVYPTFPAVTPEGMTYQDALWEACLPGGPNVDDVIATLNEEYNKALDNDVSIGKVKRLVIKDFNPLAPQDGTFEYLDK